MPQHLTYHTTTHEKSKVQKFTCSIPGCNQSYRQFWILRDHEKTHQNVYKFNCSFEGCTKKYNTRSNLEVHLRKHQGIRPFICDNCGRNYISKWNMAKHQKKGCTRFKKVKDSQRLFRIYQTSNGTKSSHDQNQSDPNQEPNQIEKKNIVIKRVKKQIEKKKKELILNEKSKENKINLGKRNFG